MATVVLNQEQTELLRELNLPVNLSTEIDDDLWCDVAERLLEEVQLHGFNESFDGENDYGKLCSSIYNAMADAEKL